MKGKIRKTIGRLLSLIAAVAMVLSISNVPVMAAQTEHDSNQGGSGSITISNTVSNEKYNIYKVFDATYSGSNVAYTYDGSNSTFLTALKGDESPFTVTQVDTSKYTVVKKASATNDSVLTFIKNNSSNLGTAVVTNLSGTGDAVKVTNLKYGYYYITTTTGSLVTINSNTPDTKVEDKNTVPSVDKKQGTTEGTYTDDDVDVNIGDTVYFQTEIKIGKGNDKQIVLKDTMSSGLTLSGSVVVKNGSTALTQGSDYSYSTEGDPTFTITILEAYVKAHNKASETSATAGDTLTVTYSAKVNSNAAINNITNGNKNSNRVDLTYSNQTSTDKVYETTEDFKLKKTDGTNFLSGAGFRLYSDFNCTTEIKLTDENVAEGEANKYYYDSSSSADGAEIKVNSADGVTIKGLKEGTYYLKETTTPDGYSTAAVQSVTVAKEKTAEVTVVNTKGSALPSTGGAGVYAFYAVGGLIVAGAVILLIRRRKAE